MLIRSHRAILEDFYIFELFHPLTEFNICKVEHNIRFYDPAQTHYAFENITRRVQAWNIMASIQMWRSSILQKRPSYACWLEATEPRLRNKRSLYSLCRIGLNSPPWQYHPLFLISSQHHKSWKCIVRGRPTQTYRLEVCSIFLDDFVRALFLRLVWKDPTRIAFEDYIINKRRHSFHQKYNITC